MDKYLNQFHMGATGNVLEFFRVASLDQEENQEENGQWWFSSSEDENTESEDEDIIEDIVEDDDECICRHETASECTCDSCDYSDPDDDLDDFDYDSDDEDFDYELNLLFKEDQIVVNFIVVIVDFITKFVTVEPDPIMIQVVGDKFRE